MFQGSSSAADCDFHALVAELRLGLALIKLDVLLPELLDELLLAIDVEPRDSGDKQSCCNQLHDCVPDNEYCFVRFYFYESNILTYCLNGMILNDFRVLRTYYICLKF